MKNDIKQESSRKDRIDLQIPSFEELAKMSGATAVGPFEELYRHMRARLEHVSESVDTMSTYPTQPGRGENPERDKYFKKCHDIAKGNSKIRLRRMVTITHLSKYRWVKEMIDDMKDCDNFSLGYLDLARYNLPFIGIILMDGKEVFITAVTFPLSEAQYFWSNDQCICQFFSNYIDRIWNDYCMKLKHGKDIFEHSLQLLDSGLMKPHISEVDLGSEPFNIVRVGAAQVDLTDILLEKDGLLRTDPRRAKEKILAFCKCAIENRVHLLVFPELCAVQEAFKDLSRISNKHNMVIVGGTFYDENKRNVVPVFIPSREPIFSEKVTLSPYECSPLSGRSANAGDKISVIRNSTCGSFAVLICADYLTKTIVNEVYDRGVEFLCVVSLNSTSQRFAVDMSRDCEISSEGIYIIYSNAVCKWRGEQLGDGRSAIFGFMDRVFLDKLETREESCKYRIRELGSEGGGMIVAEFNVRDRRPRYRSVATRPNIANIITVEF